MSTPRQQPDPPQRPANASPATPSSDVQTQDDPPEPDACASPPCALHEVDPRYRGF